MKSRFGRRLLWIAALELYAVLAILILAGALLAFGSYARSVAAQENMTLSQIVTSIRALPGHTALEEVGDRIAARYLSPGINVLLINGARRVVVYRAHRGDALQALAQRVARYPLHRWREALDHAGGAGGLGTVKVAFDPRSKR